MKYRSRSDIVGLLLDAANVGRAAKTKLMYKAYLSFNQLREYLALLVENRISNEKNTFQMKIIEHSLFRKAWHRITTHNGSQL
jgi:predicted transcriptional regulator